MLKLQYKDRRKEPLWIADNPFTIGSDPASSLVLETPHTEALHAEILLDGNETILKDCNTARGVFINGVKVVGQQPIKGDDVVRIDQIELVVIDPLASQNAKTQGQLPQWKLKSTASWMEGEEFEISDRLTIGRESSCDIQIPIEHLSRQHAELTLAGGRLHIQDLESANGTFLNGKKITKAIAKNGDKLKLDVVTFLILGPVEDSDKTIVRPRQSKTPSNTQAGTSKRTTSKSAKPSKPAAKRRKKSPDAPGQSSKTWLFALIALMAVATGIVLYTTYG